MIDNLMDIHFLRQRAICVQFVREQHRMLLAELLDKGQKCFCTCVLYLGRMGQSVPLPFWIRACWSPCRRGTSRSIQFLRSMLGGIILIEQCANLMENEPRRFLCDMDVTSQLM